MTDLIKAIEENGMDISPHRKRTVERFGSPKIPQMDPDEYHEISTALLELLFDDFGIKTAPTRDEHIRFQSILLRYYSDFSLAEVKLAFEYALAGELDQFVKSEKDLKTYGKWSTAFVSTVLRSYRKYRGSTITAYQKKLPATSEITKEDKDKLDREWCELLKKQLIACVEEKEPWPDSWCTEYVHSYLCKIGILTATKISSKTYNKAYSKALSDPNRSVFEKRKIKTEHSSGKISTIVEVIAVIETVKMDIEEILQLLDAEIIEQKFSDYAANRD